MTVECIVNKCACGSTDECSNIKGTYQHLSRTPRLRNLQVQGTVSPTYNSKCNNCNYYNDNDNYDNNDNDSNDNDDNNHNYNNDYDDDNNYNYNDNN